MFSDDKYIHDMIRRELLMQKRKLMAIEERSRSLKNPSRPIPKIAIKNILKEEFVKLYLMTIHDRDFDFAEEANKTYRKIEDLLNS